MESYQQDIIDKCKNLSSNINEYFNEEQYRLDVEQAEVITPEFLVNTAVDMVLEELKVMGVESNFDAVELINSPVDLETMYYIRSKFDSDNFYNFLKSLDEKTKSEFNQIVEDVELSEDMFINIVTYFNGLISKDVGWDYMIRSINHWCSTDAFVEHISAIMDKLFNATDPNRVYVSDENIDTIKMFMDMMQERSSRLSILAKFVMSKYSFISKSKLNTLVKKYDKDKLDPNKLPYFAEYAKYDHSESTEYPSFVNEHHRKASHHLEYWSEGVGFKNKSTITVEHACMIVLSEMIDNKSASQMKLDIEKFKPYCVILSDGIDVYAFMQELISIDYKEILLGGNV